MSIAATVLWSSIGLLAYTYAGYPLLVRAWAALRAQVVRRERIEPAVSVLVIAYNEEQRIGDKIENLLALDYPRERLEIVVASDASSDETVARAQAYAGRGVRVEAFSERRGKPAVLNDMIPRLSSDIVVLMDVRQRIEADCLHALAANFADPRVGAVSGELFLEEDADSDVGEGVGFYWRYEKFIRNQEAVVDSTVGATGAIYALRRSLFRPIPPETILDDVLIPMQIVRQGYRVLFEPAARAFDRVAASGDAEFTRKVRTIAGNFQLLFQHPWLINPIANRLWFQTVSHKFFRLLGPLCLLAAFICNLLLLELTGYRVLLVLQLLFYGGAAAGYLIRNPARKPAIVNVPYAFCLLNWATVMGFVRLLAGRQRVTWDKARG